MNAAIRSRWKSPRRHRPRRPPPGVAGWLRETGSLTAQLRRRCPGRLRVELLRQAWERPRREEARRLGMAPAHQALIREVRLHCDGIPWVFARTVIPVTSLQGANRRLHRLGERPLGAFLFAHPHLRRGSLEIAALPPVDPLVRRALGTAPAAVLWGRRSLFWLHGRPLLVAEFFLPALVGKGAP
ncbi:MAG: chorismate lyase [Gammaproteobacteria bacterium]|nr:MAG: chorismate lyase [Gammaproteobacteria bacterium]